MVTLRIVYKKHRYMKFLSHLELMKLFERVFRFHKLPLKFSEGFNPHPKMTFAAPLSVGFSSQAEIMEVQLTEEINIDRVLNMRFPEGIEVTEAKFVNSKGSLMAAVDFSEYLLKIEFDANVEDYPFEERLEGFLNQGEVTFEKKTKKGKMKTINALEMLRNFQFVYKEGNDLILRGIFASGSNGSLNPVLLGELFLKFCKMENQVSLIEAERISLLMAAEDQLVSLYNL